MSKYHITTFGCQMNQHDSERIAEVLREAGHEQTDEVQLADVIVLNTCSVREKAVQKLRSEVGRLAELKQHRPDLVFAIAGCVAQQEGARLLRRMPYVDVIVGPDNLGELPGLLALVEHGAPPQVRTEFDLAEPSFLMARPRGGRVASAFVTTMKGCDERCTFCIVPHTRGPERYRPAREVLAEVKQWVAAGVKEITLLGQTVDSYRDPLGELSGKAGVTPADGDESEFPLLLRAIAATSPTLKRLRYTSPHPRHLTESLIDAHRELDVLAKHVHMPVQAGSDRVLKRMGRRYTVAEYLGRVTRLKSAVPGLTLSTDMIVGFPGETRNDFEATLALVKEAGFVSVFGFKYSPRPFTPALKLGDDIPEEEKSARLNELFELSEGMRRRHLATLVGNEEEVLVDQQSTDGVAGGRTTRNEVVHLRTGVPLVGELVPVKITEALNHSLTAEPIDPALRSASGPEIPRRKLRRALPVVTA